MIARASQIGFVSCARARDPYAQPYIDALNAVLASPMSTAQEDVLRGQSALLQQTLDLGKLDYLGIFGWGEAAADGVNLVNPGGSGVTWHYQFHDKGQVFSQLSNYLSRGEFPVNYATMKAPPGVSDDHWGGYSVGFLQLHGWMGGMGGCGYFKDTGYRAGYAWSNLTSNAANRMAAGGFSGSPAPSIWIHDSPTDCEGVISFNWDSADNLYTVRRRRNGDRATISSGTAYDVVQPQDRMATDRIWLGRQTAGHGGAWAGAPLTDAEDAALSLFLENVWEGLFGYSIQSGPTLDNEVKLYMYRSGGGEQFTINGVTVVNDYTSPQLVATFPAGFRTYHDLGPFSNYSPANRLGTTETSGFGDAVITPTLSFGGRCMIAMKTTKSTDMVIGINLYED